MQAEKREREKRYEETNGEWRHKRREQKILDWMYHGKQFPDGGGRSP
jgi:hypothetical protein